MVNLSFSACAIINLGFGVIFAYPNVVKSREIKITGELPDVYVVQSGIDETDKILLEGVQKVNDDDKINYVYQKPLYVLSHLRLKAE